MAAAPLVVASPAGATVAAEATSAASSGGTGVATVPIAAPDLFQSPLPSLPGAFPRSLLRVVHGAGIDRAAAPLVAGDLAWLGPTANSSDNSDQHRRKNSAIIALEALFAEYGR